ncbi:TIGR00645 family protein [Ensifer adhaerens]|nr:TIGR00645 family protein [Ensifer adhaerens]HZG28129.1 TIGR00645 family protein [Ensifer sp.]
MKSLELFVERIILSSRWILVVFYLGLAAALALYGFSFLLKFIKIASNVMVANEGDMILAMLGLIDAALVGSLIVMVMISGYENFVSRFDEAEADAENKDVSFLGKLDSGSLKIKVASSIVAISSIHLLQVFLNINEYTDTKIVLLTGIHLAFVVSALMLGYLENMMSKTKKGVGKG